MSFLSKIQKIKILNIKYRCKFNTMEILPMLDQNHFIYLSQMNIQVKLKPSLYKTWQWREIWILLNLKLLQMRVVIKMEF